VSTIAQEAVYIAEEQKETEIYVGRRECLEETSI
jgi:hypothetical protein